MIPKVKLLGFAMAASLLIVNSPAAAGAIFPLSLYIIYKKKKNSLVRTLWSTRVVIPCVARDAFFCVSC
jgi:hypothetical protein